MATRSSRRAGTALLKAPEAPAEPAQLLDSGDAMSGWRRHQNPIAPFCQSRFGEKAIAWPATAERDAAVDRGAAAALPSTPFQGLLPRPPARGFLSRTSTRRRSAEKRPRAHARASLSLIISKIIRIMCRHQNPIVASPESKPDRHQNPIVIHSHFVDKTADPVDMSPESNSRRRHQNPIGRSYHRG